VSCLPPVMATTLPGCACGCCAPKLLGELPTEAQVSTGLAAGQATAVSWRGSYHSSGSSCSGEGPLKMPILQEPCGSGGCHPDAGLRMEQQRRSSGLSCRA
jgi:hypothetical protein